jgi:hypothetical protein
MTVKMAVDCGLQFFIHCDCSLDKRFHSLAHS